MSFPVRDELEARGHSSTSDTRLRHPHLTHPNFYSPDEQHAMLKTEGRIIKDGGDPKQLQDTALPEQQGRVSLDELLSDAGGGFSRTGSPKDVHQLQVEDEGEQDLQTRLREAFQESVWSHKDFLPVDDLNHIITRNSVTRKVQSLNICEDQTSLLETVRDIWVATLRNATQKITTRRKLFAVLVLMEEVPKILELIREGIYDSHLPFEFVSAKERGVTKNQLHCRNREGKFVRISSFENWSQRSHETFEHYQWYMLAPYFVLSSKEDSKVLWYDLSPKVPLPFIRFQDPPKEDEDALGFSGFGEVRQVKIHPAHRSKGNDAIDQNNIVLTVETLHEDHDQLEKKTLPLMRLARENHPHLNRLLLTIKQGTKVSLVFPSARGNLYHFWQSQTPDLRPSSISPGSVRWMARQFSGLAGGLALIHNAPKNTNRFTTDDRPVLGCHGNLCPMNILWFKEDNGVLKIADFGLTEFYSKQPFIPIGPTHRAPEYDGQVLSPAADLWTLGCILLEFLVWYTRGWKGVDEFSKRRESDEREGGPDGKVPFLTEDKFFAGDSSRQVLKGSVKDEMSRLRSEENCSGFILHVLDLIEHRLLRVQPKDRARCKDVSDILMTLNKKYDSKDYGTLKLRDTNSTTTLDSTRQLADTQGNSNEGESVLGSVIHAPLTNTDSKGKSVALLSSTEGQTWTKSADESTALATTIDPHPQRPEEKFPDEDAMTDYTSATNTDAMVYIDRLADDWTSTSNPQPPFHGEFEAEHEENDWGSDNSSGEESEDDAESHDYPRYRDVVTASSAYKWLLARVDQEILLYSPQNDARHRISEAIRARLYPSRGDRLVISKAKPPVFKVVFRSDWSPLAFVREQEYAEEPGEALEGAITITEGVEGVAEAMPCSQYLIRTWPYLGEEFIGLVKGAVRAKPGSRCSVVLFDGSKLVTWIDPTGCLALEAVGVPDTLVEVGEMFAWTTAALRSAPSDEAAIVVPFLDAEAKMNEMNEMTCRVRSSQPARRSPSARPNGQCWKDLFRNPVVVHGFPVRRRSGEEQGLEIDLGTLARLVQTRRVAIFGDRVLLKGFSTMLIPTQYAEGIVFWHVIFNEDGNRLSFADDRVSKVAGDFDLRKLLNIRNIETSRHIVGWCASVKSNAGSREAAYDIEEDMSLRQPFSEVGADRYAISIGKLISFGVSGVLGRKDKPVRNGSEPDFFRRLEAMDDRYVVFYDVQERRAWLVHALSALLHLVRASLKLSEVRGYPVLLNQDDIQEAESTRKGVAAARAVLINPDNLQLKIFKNPDERVVKTTIEEELGDDQEAGTSQNRPKVKKKRVTEITETWVHFHDRVDDMCHLLESVFDHQQDGGEKDGISARIRASPRRHLEGFQFKDLASAAQRIGPRMMKFQSRSPGGGWVDFARAIGSVTLFGNGFGELLEPVRSVESAEAAGAVNFCDRWVALPKGEDLLAVSNLVIRDIMKKRSRDGILWELVDSIYWHKPDKAFEVCNCMGTTGSQCDRVQVLIPTKFPKLRTRGLRSPSSLPEDGAVVFGHSVTFPLIWSDDPQSVPDEDIPSVSSPSVASMEPSVPSTVPSTAPSTQRGESETLDSTAPSRRSLRKWLARHLRIGRSEQSLNLGEDSEASGSGSRL
ncbi:hypothetical protein B0T10DRAFT_550846 [Thelonectria olida]|uniref:Protein kinase domain-containing protein n=1 Tax=Thelonectria olida TaxID=1576542 RepID=A0A9P8W0C2_9HYPO|nr:hypothetical protein B0T10DRAFT_550846 [Thelonectria olida]